MQSISSIVGSDLLFVAGATAFLALVGWAWRRANPFDLPSSLPAWFRVWFVTVLIVGLVAPIAALEWGAFHGDAIVLNVLIPYFVLLALQILTESIILRWFHSVVWVMVPYLYLPYRLWRLYQGLALLESSDLTWFHTLVQVEIVLWTANYGFNLVLLPQLLRWQTKDEDAAIATD